MTEYVIGVDLGQANDYTAIAVLQMGDRPTPHTVTRSTNYMTGETCTSTVRESTYQVRHLERLPLGTPYPKQVERVSAIVREVERLPLPAFDRGRPLRLVVDQTGVGRPVVDMLRQAGHRRLTAVSIHGGDSMTRDGSECRVPKRELVSILQVLLQTDRLKIAASLPEAQTLLRELLAFKVTFSATGHDTYGNDWRENDHDDAVLAVALATWAGETIRMPDAVALRKAIGIAH